MKLGSAAALLASNYCIVVPGVTVTAHAADGSASSVKTTNASSFRSQNNSSFFPFSFGDMIREFTVTLNQDNKSTLHSKGSLTSRECHFPITNADVGILECPNNYRCLENFDSSLGGSCQRMMPNNDNERQLQTLEEKCNSCDCSEFNLETGTGRIKCTVLEGVSLDGSYDGCQDTIGTTRSIETMEDGEIKFVQDCYYLSSPTKTQEACILKDSTTTICQVTFNGVACDSCTVAGNRAYAFDCSNVDEGKAGSTNSTILDFLPILNECYEPSVCKNLCGPGNQIPATNLDRSVPLPGGGQISCGYLAEIETRGERRIPVAFCSGLRDATLERCCSTLAPTAAPLFRATSAPTVPFRCQLCEDTGVIANPYGVLEEYGLFCSTFSNFASLSIDSEEVCDDINRNAYDQCCATPAALSSSDPEAASFPTPSPVVDLTSDGHSSMRHTVSGLALMCGILALIHGR